MPIRDLSPTDAHARQRAGALLIDVRAAHERALGMVEAAAGIVREELQANPAEHIPDLDTEILLICQRGARSRQVAEFLAARGYRNLASIEGGTDAWDAAGLPMQRADVDGHRRLRLDQPRRADLLAVLHHADAVGQPGDDAHVVGHQHHARARLAHQLGHQIEDLGLDRHVQRRGRLIRDQQARTAGHRPGDHRPLKDAAAQAGR